MANQRSGNSIFEVIGDTTHQLTLACMGLFGHGARSGGTLVGEILKSSQKIGNRVTGGLDDRARSLAGGLVGQAEKFVGLRMTRLLNSFQVPTSTDVHELSERVEKLDKRVSELTRDATPEAPQPAPAKRANKKTTKRKTTKRKVTKRAAGRRKTPTKKKTRRRS